MTILEATILGIVQGFTEFLPISSSGHLVLCQAILGIEQPGNEFEILVHLGTLASVLVIFFDDIKSLILSLASKKTQIFIMYILIGTLPAIGIGLGFKDLIDSLFENVTAVGGALIFTGVVLFGSSFANRQYKEHSFLTCILIGCAQAMAIIPGVSRSGMTISAALFLGLSGFQMPIPVALAGLISSFAVGVVALKWLLGWLEQGKFHYFGIYCFAVGLITLVV